MRPSITDWMPPSGVGRASMPMNRIASRSSPALSAEMIAASVIGSLCVYTTWTSGLAWNIACDTGIAFSRNQSAFWLAMISAVSLAARPSRNPSPRSWAGVEPSSPRISITAQGSCPCVGAVLRGVGPGLLADLHVVGADPHRELVAFDLAVEDDHRHALRRTPRRRRR